tara:strand:+ start:252 stop:437 length:186 start_codon:yes stop_codon:yes gene_type:complete
MLRDKVIAKIIKPIVRGSFNTRKLIIEKRDAKHKRIVVNSNPSRCISKKDEKVDVISSIKV